MSVTLAIALNIVLVIGLLSVLAWIMSRPRHLRPHRPEASNVDVVRLPRGAVVETVAWDERRAA